MSDADTYRPGGEDCEEVADWEWARAIEGAWPSLARTKLWDGEAW